MIVLKATHVTSEGDAAYEFAPDLFIIDGGRVVIREDAAARGLKFRVVESSRRVTFPESSSLTARALAKRVAQA